MAALPRPGRRAVVQLWDGRFWPCAGFYAELPVFRFRWAPSGLATVRQLAAEGMRPGGQEVAAWLAWGRPRRPRWAYLFRRDLAKPKRTASEAQRASLVKARQARQTRRYCAEHAFGEWLACGCGQGIADHQDEFFADGSCAFEFRTCEHCPASEERHVTECPATTVPDVTGMNVRPGGPSAKTSHRAGSPNHQNDSKENPMVERPGRPTEDQPGGGA